MKAKFNHTFTGYSNLYFIGDKEQSRFKIKHEVILKAVKKYTSGIFAEVCITSDNITSALFNDLTKFNHTNVIFYWKLIEGQKWITRIEYKRKDRFQCDIWIEKDAL